jgi:hypothetical protein
MTPEVIAMLAEKFFLVLETMRSHASDDRTESRDQHRAAKPDQAAAQEENQTQPK